MNSGNRIWDEADIGSGEKTAGQRETEEMIRQIPPLESGTAANDDDSDDGDDAASEAGLGPEASGLTMEQERSLDKDEPNNELDGLDPVPPKG